MIITYEYNEYGERVKVTVFENGTVVRELDIEVPVLDE